MAEDQSEPDVPVVRRNLRPRKPPSNPQEDKEKSESETNGTKSFVCKTCGAKFVFKQHLTRHKQYHSKVREVGKCYFCDSKFNSLQQLHEHLLTCPGRLQLIGTKRHETYDVESKQHETKQNGNDEHFANGQHEARSIIQEDACSIDPNDDLDDVDFVLNDKGDIEATQRTLEEMRQREIKFVENLWELLTLLLGENKNTCILDAQKPVAQNLEAVIVHCGHSPIRATGTYTSRLRENCKLLFRIAVGPSVEKFIQTKPIEVVLEEVIKKGKESVSLAQEVIIIDSDSE